MVRFNVMYRQDSMPLLAALLNNPIRMDIQETFKSFAPFKYKDLFIITVGESTVSLGVGFNGSTREDNLKGFIEFNPNKVFPEWLEEFYKILSYCSDVSIARMDIAIDIPINRAFLSLVKDNRHKEIHWNNKEDKTEYLGVRNTPGRVKLYNKALESKLAVDLTRLEITCKCDLADFKKHVPSVICSGDFKQMCFMDFDYTGLNKTDRVLVKLLNDLPADERNMYVKQLAYEKRKKIEPFVSDNEQLSIEYQCVCNIINMFKDFCK